MGKMVNKEEFAVTPPFGISEFPSHNFNAYYNNHFVILIGKLTQDGQAEFVINGTTI